MDRNDKGKTVLDYIRDTEWAEAIRPFDQPFKRTGTPKRLRNPYGSKSLLKVGNLNKPLNRYKPKPGSLFRFSYTSSFDDNREHDLHPFIILLTKDATGKIFNRSETARDEKYPSVYGKQYFYGLNLNYLRWDLASLYIEAINKQRVIGDFVSHENIAVIDPTIPKHAFRMYYVDWCSGFRAVRLEDGNK